MRKILLAVDDTKGSVKAAEMLASWGSTLKPEGVVLLHVQRPFGRSLVGEALESDMDIEEISSALEGTEYQEKLDRRSQKVLAYFSSILEKAGYAGIQPSIRSGHPAEQILAAAQEEGADLIVVGSRGKRLHSLLLGSVSREVANTSEIPVLVVR